MEKTGKHCLSEASCADAGFGEHRRVSLNHAEGQWTVACCPNNRTILKGKIICSAFIGQWLENAEQLKDQVLSDPFILSNTKDLAKPWLLELDSVPFPWPQDDGLVLVYGASQLSQAEGTSSAGTNPDTFLFPASSTYP